MDHNETLKAYEKALETQDWESVSPFIAEDAVVFFSSGTFKGKEAVEEAFTRTFKLIQDETYALDQIDWIVVTDTVATCVYHFHWTGKIDGKDASGGGRGTAVLRCEGGVWSIIHEHLGPHPRNS